MATKLYTQEHGLFQLYNCKYNAYKDNDNDNYDDNNKLFINVLA